MKPYVHVTHGMQLCMCGYEVLRAFIFGVIAL